MASLLEATGAAMRSIFVPADVIASQEENQRMLNERAQTLNSDIPATLARATRNGTMTDGQARQSLQSMNSSLFLSGNREREMGQATVDIVQESVANAPAVFADTVRGGINTVGGTIWRAIPWWVWTIAGIYLAIQLATMIRLMRVAK